MKPINPRRTPWVVVSDGRITAALARPDSERARKARRDGDKVLAVETTAPSLYVGDLVVDFAGQALLR